MKTPREIAIYDEPGPTEHRYPDWCIGAQITIAGADGTAGEGQRETLYVERPFDNWWASMVIGEGGRYPNGAQARHGYVIIEMYDGDPREQS